MQMVRQGLLGAMAWTDNRVQMDEMGAMALPVRMARWGPKASRANRVRMVRQGLLGAMAWMASQVWMALKVRRGLREKKAQKATRVRRVTRLTTSGWVANCALKNPTGRGGRWWSCVDLRARGVRKGLLAVGVVRVVDPRLILRPCRWRQTHQPQTN